MGRSHRLVVRITTCRLKKNPDMYGPSRLLENSKSDSSRTCACIHMTFSYWIASRRVVLFAAPPLHSESIRTSTGCGFICENCQVPSSLDISSLAEVSRIILLTVALSWRFPSLKGFGTAVRMSVRVVITLTSLPFFQNLGWGLEELLWSLSSKPSIGQVISHVDQQLQR